MEDADITEENQQNTRPHLKKYMWPKGVSGNPAGRPKGSLSAITRIKQMFEENPDDFDEWLTEYLKNPMNQKHVVEMIDSKPMQKVDHTTLGKEMPVPIINVQTYNSDPQGDEPEEADTSDTGGN